MLIILTILSCFGLFAIIIWEIINSDWYPVWFDSAEWTCDDETIHFCHYTIFYSKSRNDYKLKCSGYRSKEHTYYSYAIKKLVEFKKTIPNK